jgi:NAD(P)-dependent dehydrogenase (short-subunit alcohol dehydrogenase family)
MPPADHVARPAGAAAQDQGDVAVEVLVGGEAPAPAATHSPLGAVRKRPGDVAQAALFLASSAADYVTGEVLAVNGGAFAGRAYLPLGRTEGALIDGRPDAAGDGGSGSPD